MSARGLVRAVIFDWAGTAVDFGSIAPVAAFAAAFESARVPVSTDEIRGPMGLEKRQHLAQLLNDNAIAARWRDIHGANPTQRDVDVLYAESTARLADCLPRYAQPVPGLLGVLSQLRAAGIKIGSNTGYSASLMRVLSQASREHGFEPDCIVSASDVAEGRPAPDLSLRCLKLLGVATGGHAIKVDDTRAGIQEGRNAGLWTTAVAISGNEVGLSLEEWDALDAAAQGRLRERAYAGMRAWGADYVIDTVADLVAVVESIERRIASGERPLPS